MGNSIVDSMMDAMIRVLTGPSPLDILMAPMGCASTTVGSSREASDWPPEEPPEHFDGTSGCHARFDDEGLIEYSARLGEYAVIDAYNRICGPGKEPFYEASRYGRSYQWQEVCSGGTINSYARVNYAFPPDASIRCKSVVENAPGEDDATDAKRCPEGMVYIPEGEFRMGSEGIDTDEQPVHDVNVPAFCMDRHEVTNAEYAKYYSQPAFYFELIATSCDGLRWSVTYGRDPEALAKEKEPDGDQICSLEVRNAITTPSYSDFDGPNQPVVRVPRPKAKEYCEAEGKRLPTEAEWEKAARGPEGYEYGTRSGELNYEEAHYGADRTANVCSYPANGYGLCDMTGNVLEWTAGYYYNYATGGIFDGRPRGPHMSTTYKTIRGGSWKTLEPIYLRAAERRVGGDDPRDDRDTQGFRCAADPLDTQESD